MKLVTFETKNNEQIIGALVDANTTIIKLQAASIARDGKSLKFFDNMLEFLKGGAAARYEAQAIIEYVSSKEPSGVTIPFDSIKLLPPVPFPESIRETMTFEQHIINAIRVKMKTLGRIDEIVEKIFGRKRTLAYRINKSWYERPIYYFGNRHSVIASGAEVTMPHYTEKFDYELEFGIFIGKKGVNIPREKASEYIGGYTIFNDWSARDIQAAETGGFLGPAKGKDFDTGNAMGPYLVTPDEIGDPYNLTMIARVNGEEWSRGTSAEMHWKFEDLIAYMSRAETLYPGDFIGSGTCSGSLGKGCGLEMNRFLKPDDTVELEVEKLGILHNRIVADTMEKNINLKKRDWYGGDNL